MPDKYELRPRGFEVCRVIDDAWQNTKEEISKQHKRIHELEKKWEVEKGYTFKTKEREGEKIQKAYTKLRELQEDLAYQKERCGQHPQCIPLSTRCATATAMATRMAERRPVTAMSPREPVYLHEITGVTDPRDPSYRGLYGIREQERSRRLAEELPGGI